MQRLSSLPGRLKRWLYLLHRWVGIALCLVMALWFLSGMVMLYVGYPKLTPQEQRDGLAPLPATGCCVPVAQAQAQAAMTAATPSATPSGPPSAWRLTTVAGQPRYLFGEGRQPRVAVDALSGQPITAVDPAAALAAARHFAHGVPAQWLGMVQEDAWTHSRALDPQRPLHRVAVQDAEQRWLYVSGVTGEVVRDATLTERRWGWLGAWLHWLYALRGGGLDPAWTQVLIWLSIAGGLLALSGLVVGVWRWRFRGRYKSGSRSPYRGRMARWHHVLGLAGGTLALTWVLSGLASMNPWKVFESPGPRPDRSAWAGGPLRAAPGEVLPEAGPVLQALREQGQAAQELHWQRLDGAWALRVQTATATWLVDAQGQRLPPRSEAQLVAAAERLLRCPAGAAQPCRVVSREWLTAYDAHYYARDAHTMTGQRERPLPVLRLVLDDPAQHWVVADPATGAIVQLSSRRQRVERWLFAFLHSFDLPLLLGTRPAWDAWMLGFSSAGLALCLTGVVMGWRRLAGGGGGPRPRRGTGSGKPMPGGGPMRPPP